MEDELRETDLIDAMQAAAYAANPELTAAVLHEWWDSRPRQYQIFWKDNDRPVDDYKVIKFGGDYQVAGFVQLYCDDAVRLVNMDEVRMIVIKDPS